MLKIRCSAVAVAAKPRSKANTPAMRRDSPVIVSLMGVVAFLRSKPRFSFPQLIGKCNVVFGMNTLFSVNQLDLNLLRLSLNGLCWPRQNHLPPGGVIVSFAVNKKMSYIISAVRVRVDNLKDINVTDLRWMPHWIALSESWRHLYSRFQNKVA